MPERVRLSELMAKRYAPNSLVTREVGTVIGGDRSFVRVQWDGSEIPETWHATALRPAFEEIPVRDLPARPVEAVSVTRDE